MHIIIIIFFKKILLKLNLFIIFQEMYTFVDNLHSVLNKNNMIPVNVTNHEISYKILMNI